MLERRLWLWQSDMERFVACIKQTMQLFASHLEVYYDHFHWFKYTRLVDIDTAGSEQ